MQSEAEAVLLGCRIPPPTEEEIANLPGATETWQKYPFAKPKSRAVCEERLTAAMEVEQALGNAFFEARQKVKTHPMVSEKVSRVLHVLGEIRNTVEQCAEASGRPKRQSGRFSGRMSLDPQEILSRYTRSM